MSFTFTNTLTPGLKKLRDKLKMGADEGADARIKSKVALQFLKYCNAGSGNETTTPPIRTGNLRGSASVFVGPFLIQTTRGEYPEGKPAMSGDEKNMDIISIVYNASYAGRMHEQEWKPGPVSAQAGNVGNKWVEKHLKADAQSIFKMYADLLKKEIEG